MSSKALAKLIDIVHRPPMQDWTTANEIAFAGLFGSEGGRYGKNAQKALRLRAPSMKDGGVTFAAYLHPSNPHSGAYGGIAFVIFPIPEGASLIGLVIGTQGLAPDDAILARPGHSRKVRAICAWLNAEFGRGEMVAWAKQDPTRTDQPIPDLVRKKHPHYYEIFEKYGPVLYGIYAPTADDTATEQALAALLDLLLEERGFQPVAAHTQDRDRRTTAWFDHLMPDLQSSTVQTLLNLRRYVILQGPPGTGKNRMATKLLAENYQANGRSIQFHANTTYENFVGGIRANCWVPDVCCSAGNSGL